MRSSIAGDVATVSLRSRERASANVSSPGWGWLPALALIGGLGLVSVALGMQIAERTQANPSWFGSTLLWLGLALIYIPVALRQALPDVSARERIALIIWLGIALYLVKVLRTPSGFGFHDEFPHWRTAFDIVQIGRLFTVNSLQEISATYPGLEIVTSAFASMAGASVFASGLLLIAVARLIAVLSVYLLYREIGGDERIAGIGAIIAMAYPNFLLWSSQFSYESLALPLATTLVLLAVIGSTRLRNSRGLRLIALILLAAIIVTHHLTSYALAALLVSLYLGIRFHPPIVTALTKVFARLPRRLAALFLVEPELSADRRMATFLWRGLMLLTIVASFAWLVFAGSEVVHYMGPHIERAIAGVTQLLNRQGGRTLFVAASLPTPAWEKLLAFAFVLLIAVGLPVGLLHVWRRFRSNPVAVVFAVLTFAYPVTLVLRASRGGAEISNRAWDFLFVVMGFVLATGAVALLRAAESRAAALNAARTDSRQRAARSAPALTWAPAIGLAIYLSVIFAGSVVIGAPLWTRLPGSYLVGGDTRGLQSESRFASEWVRAVLGPDNGVIADNTNNLLMGSYGEQYIVNGMSWVFISAYLSPGSEVAELVKRGVQYIVVDYRVTTQLPRRGFYFEEGEPGRGGGYREPFDRMRLAKFDREPCLSRVFDSGNIAIYSVGPMCAVRADSVQADAPSQD